VIQIKRMLMGKTIVEVASELKDGVLSSVELTKQYIKDIRTRNLTVHAYLDVLEAEAIDQAHASDERRAEGKSRGLLDGIPLAVKDNILIEGTRTTAGSKILENYQAVYDASVIRSLREAGTVFLGKTNMDEFAMGSSTENSAYGPTNNPRDLERVPGGSSGGSAAAVAADLCVAALGSDTGGSIRQPAAFCGTVGLKPTYGRVSRYGLIAMASSFDQIGPLTKTSADAGLLFEAMMGRDDFDQTSSMSMPFQPKLPKRLDGLRIGIPKQAMEQDGLQDAVASHFGDAIEILKSLGATVKEIDLPYADEALAVYYVLMPCEVSANLSRFDGIRYGVRAQANSLLDTYTETRELYLGEEVRRRILLGAYALSEGYQDQYYGQAQKLRQLIRRAYNQAFEEVDIIATPTTPTTAYKLGEKTEDPLAMYLGDIYTVGANVTGLPAISIPVDGHEGLPIGMHLMAEAHKDDVLIDVGFAYEQQRDNVSIHS